MVHPNTLSVAQVTLLAILLTTESNLSQLQVLASERKDVLTETVLCRLLLTFLPANIDNQTNLLSFLTQLNDGFEGVSDLDVAVDTNRVESFSVPEVDEKLHELRFVNTEDKELESAGDILSMFLIDWIHQLEQTCGISSSVVQLINSVADTRPSLRQWSDAYLLPLLRLQNEFYPGKADSIDLSTVENMRGSHGVKTLLQFAESDREKAQIGRDLDQVVSPWVQGASRTKRRRISEPAGSATTSWKDVNEWIHTTSHNDFALAAKAVLEWSGPPMTDSNNLEDEQIDTRAEQAPRIQYAQTVLALVLNSRVTDSASIKLLQQLLDRATSLTASNPIPNPTKGLLVESSRADLLDNSLLRPENPLTNPSDEALSFLYTCLSDQEILQGFKLSLNISSIVEIALFGSEEKQKQEFNKIIQQVPRLTTSGINWTDTREKLRNLNSGQNSSSASKTNVDIHFLGRVPQDYLDVEILDTILATGQYSVAKDVYIDNTQQPLPIDAVKHRVIAAILNAYDNASNGNRTRGGVKKAAELLKAFQPSFSNSGDLIEIENLIKATHSLSFYQVTLQHGVPFQPVNIRVHRDPISLIEAVLRQNHKAYTKLDDLVEIGRNLVRAGLPKDNESLREQKSTEEKLFDATHRVTYLAITAALADNDFDTAYSYITTRLSTNPSQSSLSPFTDDTSWRAAYEAGKYRPPITPKNIHDRIASLSKRMDLLALALTLTPSPKMLPEILSTWRRCEEEMDSLKSHAVQEERAFEAQGETIVPGGFGAGDRELDAADTRRLLEKRAMNSTAPTYEEEAPMGLFDVAKGAASAIRKSAFPLRSAGSDNFKVRQAVGRESERSSLDEGREGQSQSQRVRKRDMVSNMVTGGLVSGVSWMLGATPATGTARDDHDER